MMYINMSNKDTNASFEPDTRRERLKAQTSRISIYIYFIITYMTTCKKKTNKTKQKTNKLKSHVWSFQNSSQKSVQKALVERQRKIEKLDIYTKRFDIYH